MRPDNDLVAMSQVPEPLAAERRSAAVALAYGTGDAAPRVLAKGRGLIAEAIIARAKDSAVYVHESPELVALLMQVNIDEHIPPQLYVAVAELLAWLYRHDRADLPAAPHAASDAHGRTNEHN